MFKLVTTKNKKLTVYVKGWWSIPFDKSPRTQEHPRIVQYLPIRKKPTIDIGIVREDLLENTVRPEVLKTERIISENQSLYLPIKRRDSRRDISNNGGNSMGQCSPGIKPSRVNLHPQPSVVTYSPSSLTSFPFSSHPPRGPSIEPKYWLKT